MKYLVLVAILLSIVSCKSSTRNQDRLEGCRDAIFKALTKKYGQPPVELRDGVLKNITNDCQEMLGE